MRWLAWIFYLGVVTCLRAEQETVVEAEPSPGFIRVAEADDATRLQTAVVKFTKGEASVELVGAVHIADRKYYQALNKRFEAYDALLFEGIGGGKPAAGIAAEKEAPVAPDVDPGVPRRKGKLDGLHTAYESGARWLGLSYQMKEIDYGKANFVHADLSMDEFIALQAERGESLIGFALKAGLKKPEGEPVKEPNSFKMLTSLVRGDKDGLKRELVHSLGAGDDQVAALAGDNVIIGDRNAKCLQVLDREVLAGRKKLGIFYGAAHFPDMTRRLRESGWAEGELEWLTAWEIGKPEE
ncbi:hypothetical protein [Luteolibacter marinus]|uniref:hypothetical protein n=1 Tax=Luteolibacter marinus TaxID=2776705 RepID=UPI001868C351|nr:hypothetical protein [Luteolibacter marinus]